MVVLTSGLQQNAPMSTYPMTFLLSSPSLLFLGVVRWPGWVVGLSGHLTVERIECLTA